MARGAKKGFVLYYDYRKHLAILNDEERGKLLMALLDYGETHEAPELDGAALMAFSFIANQIDRDAEKYAETCRKRSEAGRQGGRPSKASEDEDKAKKANAFSENQNKAKKADTNTNTNKDTNTNTNTDTEINTPPISPEGGKTPDAQERRFAEFWAAYPKKVGKKAAQTAWNRLKPDAALFESIMQAVSVAKTSEQWVREGGRYIPNPSTWINQGRWDDELPPTGTVHQLNGGQSRNQAGGRNPFLALLEGSAN